MSGVPEQVRNAIITGAVLGVVAACVVWYLERFEVARMFGEMRSYMERQDGFRDFLERREGEK